MSALRHFEYSRSAVNRLRKLDRQTARKNLAHPLWCAFFRRKCRRFHQMIQPEHAVKDENIG